MIRIIIACVFISFSNWAVGQIFTGSDLRKACRNPLSEALCNTYISGVSDGAASTQQFYVGNKHQKPVVCPPVGADNYKLGLVVRQFLEIHPEKLEQPASVLVIGALITAFPCSIQ